MSSVSSDPITMKPGATVRVEVDCSKYGLASAETIVGTPTVDPDGLTAGAPVVNSATFVNKKGGTCAIGKGVIFALTAPSNSAGQDYDVELTFVTNGSPAQTLPVRIPVYVRNA